MKIEFNLPDAYENDILVLCYKDKSIPIAYLNIYESGDVWIKTKSCEECAEENRRKCCQGCPMYTIKGCLLQLQNPNSSNKPYNCVVNPPPNQVLSRCALEFECVKGKNKGKIRKVREPDFLREEC